MAEAAGLANVVCSEGSATDTGLAPGSLDVVMLRHVLAHNGGREQVLSTSSRPGPAWRLRIPRRHRRDRHADPAARERGALAEMAERYAAFHAGLGNDLSVGLRLGEMLERAGLDGVDHRGRYQIIRPQPGMRPPAWAARAEMLAAV